MLQFHRIVSSRGIEFEFIADDIFVLTSRAFDKADSSHFFFADIFRLSL
jgi:hypothetical protein